jgi:hypothetical protein
LVCPFVCIRTDWKTIRVFTAQTVAAEPSRVKAKRKNYAVSEIALSKTEHIWKIA